MILGKVIPFFNEGDSINNAREREKKKHSETKFACVMQKI